MRLAPVRRATVPVRFILAGGAGEAGNVTGRRPFPPYLLNVPKNDDRRFGSDHFDPSPDPVNECGAVRPISASSTAESGWNHCMAPQVSSWGACLETSSVTGPPATCT